VEDVVKHLKLVPLFSSLSQRQLKGLARDFKERRVPSGTSLVKQGHMSGVDFFVIVEGDASVTVNGTEVGRLRPGDHFGELGLIGGQARQATVTAEGPMRCLAMASWDFRRFVQKKTLIPNFPEKDAIAKCIAGLSPGQLASHLSREPPRTLSDLYNEAEKYARSDADHRRRVEQ